MTAHHSPERGRIDHRLARDWITSAPSRSNSNLSELRWQSILIGHRLITIPTSVIRDGSISTRYRMLRMMSMGLPSRDSRRSRGSENDTSSRNGEITLRWVQTACAHSPENQQSHPMPPGCVRRFRSSCRPSDSRSTTRT